MVPDQGASLAAELRIEKLTSLAINTRPSLGDNTDV